MSAKKFTFALVIIALIIVALAIGLVLGKKQGKIEGLIEAEEKFAPIVDLAFPKPPAEMYSLIGTVKGIYGGTIDLEVKDPDDYLPHTDGTAQRTEIRYANITSATEIFIIDYTRRDINGNPARDILKLSDIKIGNLIKVTSNSNIKYANKFDVSEVEVLR